MSGKLLKAWNVFREKGLTGLYRRVLWEYSGRNSDKVYQRWIKEYDTINDEDRVLIPQMIEKLSSKPLISVVMPVYNVEEKWLRKAIESVTEQLYTHWELCIADDCSTRPHIRKVLDEYAARDARIKVVFRETNGHISAASNSGLELATGEFTALLDHDDELAAHALFMAAEAINANPRADMIYSDEDLIDTRGQRFAPKFKPDWSPDLLLSLNLPNHLSVYRTSILNEIGGFRTGFEGSQDYDLALRFSERIADENIVHIPHVLYHWRAIRGSVALASTAKPYAHERARKAIESHFDRTGVAAKSVRGFGQLHRTIYDFAGDRPLVSIIVAADRDVRALVEDIVSATEYEPFEIIVAAQKPIGKFATSENVKLIEYKGESRFSALNSAAKTASGPVLCFIDGSTIVRSGDWLREMVSNAVQEKTGAVGAKILYPDNTIKHAGLLMGIKNGVGRAHHKFHEDDPGNLTRLQVTQNFAAVSAECLAIRKEVFDSIGGFDAANFPDVYADVDLCLRLIEKGYRNVWTPWAELVQTGGPQEADEAELERLRTRWKGFFERDPYYNPNFSSRNGDFSLSFPPRIGKFSL